jgi:hypothetical protein
VAPWFRALAAEEKLRFPWLSTQMISGSTLWFSSETKVLQAFGALWFVTMMQEISTGIQVTFSIG